MSLFCSASAGRAGLRSLSLISIPEEAIFCSGPGSLIVLLLLFEIRCHHVALPGLEFTVQMRLGDPPASASGSSGIKGMLLPPLASVVVHRAQNTALFTKANQNQMLWVLVLVLDSGMLGNNTRKLLILSQKIYCLTFIMKWE